MGISVKLIKQLRALTGAGINDCRAVLKESNSNIQKATEILRKKGLEIVKKKQALSAKQGRIESYIHSGGRLGSIVEINCQTDFAAKTSEFISFAKDIAMQITAMNPKFIKKEDVPNEKLPEGKEQEKFYETNCLLEQPFIKDQSIKVRDYLHSLIAKTGENIIIKRFTRFELGQE